MWVVQHKVSPGVRVVFEPVNKHAHVSAKICLQTILVHATVRVDDVCGLHVCRHQRGSNAVVVGGAVLEMCQQDPVALNSAEVHRHIDVDG